MKRFEFPLATALRWRVLQKSQEEDKLVRLNASRDALQAKLRAIDDERSGTLVREACNMFVTGSELRQLGSYLVGLETQRLITQNQLAVVERTIADQRIRCMDAGRAEELLVSLRRKKLKEWRYKADLELETLAAESYLAGMSRAAQLSAE